MKPKPQRPATDDKEAWKVYWTEQKMRWRTEPEIDYERQKYLSTLRSMAKDTERPGYAFDGIQLSRADVEWLLATHESGGAIGPVEDWNDPKRPWREGLYLAGADLRKVNLSDLPLAGADLSRARLEEALLYNTHLEEAQLVEAHLEDTSLIGAQLQNAGLIRAHLEGASLGGTHLEGADLESAHLEGAFLYTMTGFANDPTHLEGANLNEAHLEGAELSLVRLENAILWNAHLEGATIRSAHLEGAELHSAHFGGKHVPADDVKRVRRWVPAFPEILPPADLSGAFFDNATILKDVSLGDEDLGCATLGDVSWGSANLAVIEWTRRRSNFLRLGNRIEAIELGDEREARSSKERDGKPKGRATRLLEYRDAVRANRQLATVLRNQGLSEDADRFAYKAQMLQRQVLQRQGRWGAVAGSWLLDLVAGYGYQPMRSFITYAVVVLGFAVAYFVLGIGDPSRTLSWNEALVVSMTAFHGRGFFASAFLPGDPQAAVAATEALVGLLIEITFIATFTQRFFAR